MKILAFATTNSRQSINKQLVTYAATKMAESSDAPLKIEVVDMNDYEMPIYSPERENDHGIPASAHRFFNQLKDADGLLISFAEYNGSYTTAFKNVFDWTSRISMQLFGDTPTLLMSASPGPNGGKMVLETAVKTLPYFGADIVGSYSVAHFYDNFDKSKQQFSNETCQLELDTVLQSALARMSNSTN